MHSAIEGGDTTFTESDISRQVFVVVDVSSSVSCLTEEEKKFFLRLPSFRFNDCEDINSHANARVIHTFPPSIIAAHVALNSFYFYFVPSN